jgi:PBSX family phage terminase large subunit
MIELNPRQIEAYNAAQSRINIFDGSVRSGKTICSLFWWANYVGRAPAGNLLMSGKTLKTLERNVLSEMKEIGIPIEWSLSKKEARLWGRTLYLEGANDNRALDKILGLTISGHYGDEVTKWPDNYFKMGLSRMSAPGAKSIFTTNPDSPYHWLKKEYLDRSNELDLQHVKFVIDDNPKLDPDYVAQIKLEYTGLWYKRYIQGLWVVAEGAVYDMFDDKLHVVKPDEMPKMINYWVGVDYGTSNQTVFLLVGQSRDGGLYLCKEYVWDSRTKGRQKTDAEYVEDYKEWIGGVSPVGIYVDPSAASFAVAMKRGGYRTSPANNDVLHGIREVGTLLTSGFLKFNSECKNSIEQMSAYVWDSRSQELGEDKPMKQADHCPDALRYLIRSTHRYWKPNLRAAA